MAGKRSGPSLALSITILLVGIGMGVVGLIGLGAPVVRNLSSGTTFEAPGDVTVNLQPGHYGIYTEQRGGFSAVIGADEVQITTPDGNRAYVRQVFVNEARPFDGTNWRLVMEFSAETSGSYHIQVDTLTQTRMLVGRRLVDSVNASWVVAVLLGGGLAVLGMILLIVGIVRRGRATPTMAGPWQPPYGGGPYGGPHGGGPYGPPGGGAPPYGPGPGGGYSPPGGPGAFPSPGGGYPPQVGAPPGGYPPAGASGWAPSGATPAQPAPWEAPPSTPAGQPSYEPYRPPVPTDDPTEGGWAAPSGP